MEPSPNDVEAYQKWVERMDRGAGELYLAIEDDQKHHLGGVLDNPRKMWELLKCGNQSKKTGTRFNAYDDLFSPFENKRMKVLKTLLPEFLRKYVLSKTYDHLLSRSIISTMNCIPWPSYAHFQKNMHLLSPPSC